MDRKDRQSIPNIDSQEGRLEVLDLPEVRISSACLVRIQDNDGRFALLINQNRAKKGDIVLTPIGGAIEVNEEGMEELKQLLEIEESSFEKGNDLRFKMKGEKANQYREWFIQRKNREIDPTREVEEELVDESKLLDKDDLETMKSELAGYSTELAETSRTGQEGQMTLRLLEINDTQLDPETLDKLVELSKTENAQIRFVAEEEIMNGQTEDGVKIGTVSKSILNPKEGIEPFV